jgi:pyruvate dehydrogenase E1 component beta subunit
MYREMTQAEALREALREEMLRDRSVFVMGEDVGPYGGIYTVTKGLWEEFGERRVQDTPISEAGFIGSGLGAALVGGRPVVELMFGDFIAVAMDQLANQAAKACYMSGGNVKASMVVRTTLGARGATAAQHSQSLESLFLHIPGLKVALPSTPHDARGLLRSAIRGDDPVVFIEHKLLYFTKGRLPDGEYLVPLGEARIARPGADATVVSLSHTVHRALKAADRLAAEGIEVEVIDLRTLVPLDLAAVLASVRKTNRAVIVDEACRTGGWGAEVAAEIQARAFDDLDAPVLRVGAKQVPVPYSKPLEDFVLPNEDGIIAAVRAVRGRAR